MTREEFSCRLQTCRKRLFIAALSVTKNKEDAEDAVGTAILRALKKYEGLKDEKRFDAWMLTVTVNEAKRLSSGKRYYESLDELYDVFADDGNAEGNVAFFDMLASAGLNNKCRKIMIMKFLYGYSLAETAQLMKLPLSSVKSEYYRGLEKLREKEGIK